MVRAIRAGIGPDGRTRLYGHKDEVRVLRTGSEVARFFAETAGAMSLAPRIVKEIAIEAERDLGDGTARLVVALHAMLGEGIRHVEAGVAPHELADALTIAVRRFTERLAGRAMAQPSLDAVARSAGASGAVAAALAGIALQVGPNGSLDVVENDTPDTVTRTGDGYVFDAECVSYALPSIELDAPHVLVANEKIADFGQLAPFLEAFATRGKSLLIVARDVTGPALQSLVRNRLENGLRAVALRPVAAGEEAAETLQDLAIAAGAQLIGSEHGSSLHALRPTMLGHAERFSHAQRRATLASPGGDEEAVSARRRLLLAEAEAKKYLSLDHERLLRRAGRIAGRWAELRVGGHDSWQIEGAMTAARRAAAAVRSAMRGGVIAGGIPSLTASLPGEHVSGEPARLAADACLRAAVSVLHRLIAASGPTAPQSAACAACPEGADSDPSVQDPLELTASIFTRAASGAAILLRTEALLVK